MSRPMRHVRQVSSSDFHSDCALELSHYVNNPHLHDVIILCHQTTFYAHRDVLRCRSAALDTLFRSSSHSVIEIATDPTVVLMMLKYIYTSRCPDKDSATAGEIIELVRLAGQLQLTELHVNLCMRFYDIIRERGIDRDERVRAEEGVEGLGEGGGSGGNEGGGLLRHHRLEPFLDASRLEGRVEVTVGPYRFRRQSAVLLAARSTWFADRIDAPDSVVDASAVPVAMVALVLRFLRMEGTEDLSTIKDAAEAMHWAWVMGVQSLQSWAEHIIVTRHLNSDNVCAIWESPACSEYLGERCQQFIECNFMEIGASTGFMSLRPDLVKLLLNSGRINADTIEMMDVLRRWAHSLHDDPNETDQLLAELLPPNTLFNMSNRMAILGVADRNPLSVY